MTVPSPKRLIEVDLPIKRISAHARREKSIRHGHISTLHIWWARRPLAACRAVILGALWPDPADVDCPERFRKEARERMIRWARVNAAKASAESFERLVRIQKNERVLDDPVELRRCLLDFIADFANWDNSNDAAYLETSRVLVQVAHEALGGTPGTLPLVIDPFAGGGAIPLEALRVGADAFASDLNPVAVLLNKVVLEYIPKYGQRLADEVRKWGEWVRKEAEKELAEFYPKEPDGAAPIAYLWARTIRCEGPGCGAEVPLMTSLWLGKKPHNPWSLRLKRAPAGSAVDFETVNKAPLNRADAATVARGSATCPLCHFTMPMPRVREQLRSRRGGSKDARFVCVVCVGPGTGRVYRAPSPVQVTAAEKARPRAATLFADLLLEPTPTGGGSGAGRAFSQQKYGMLAFSDLFSDRQILTLGTLAQKVASLPAHATTLDAGLLEATQICLALNLDKLADYGSTFATWSSPASQETVRNTFSRQALSMTWDFAEAFPFAASSGGWSHNLEFLANVLQREGSAINVTGTTAQHSACSHSLPNDAADAFVTDPPYYDAIPYADLSDYFVAWLKRALMGTASAEHFATLSPKDDECVVDETKGHDRQFFEQTMRGALSEGRRVVRPNGVGVVVFAHKATSAWEAQIQALVDAGWIVTGSWPIDTERAGRMRANASAALASSIHLVCRPRENPDGSVRADALGDWRDVLSELPKRIHEWMPRLAEEGVVGADAIFACLGPALEVFSRYSRVEKASGEHVTLKEYLEHVWAAVAKEALSMIFAGAETSGFEEDARLTAMWLWTLSAGGGNGKAETSKDDEEGPEEDEADEKRGTKAKLGGFALEYDAARKIAQGLGAHLEELTTLVEVKGETARLLPVAERTRALFGRAETETPTTRRKKKAQQMKLGFAQELEDAEEAGGWGQKGAPRAGQTVLDRVHQAMILFAAGRGEASRRFLIDEGAGRDARFWRLAQALAALYPAGTDERRWVEGVLARKKSLGF